MTPPPAVDRSREISAVGLARAASLTSLLGLLIAWVGPIAVIFAVGVEIHYGGFHIGTGKATVAAFEDLLGVIVFGALLSLVSVVLYLVSFNSFRKVGAGFGGPEALVVIGLLGMLLIIVGFALLLNDFFQAVGCTASSGSSSCLDYSQLQGAVLAILGGLFLSFLGWIGLVIGIYRIGKRYNSTITKVGGILMIIPVVGLIAPVLVFVGTHQIIGRLRSQPGLNP
jgi:Protein of unknown function (DUF973)